MFKSTNFTNVELVNLSKEIAVIGVQATPLTSLLLSKGFEKATSTIYTWREKTLSHEEDITVAEGSETTVFTESARRELNNALEIFKKGVSVSGTAQAMQNAVFAQEVSDRLLELKVNMEKKFINGVKDDGSTSGKRQMAGLIAFADASNAVTGSMSEALVKQAMRKLWEQNLAEGNYYALVNADVKEAIDNIYANRYSYQHKTNDFGLIVDSIETNYGTLNLILSKHVPADKMIVFNDAYVRPVFLREPIFEPLAKTGDNVKGHVIAEATLKVASPKAVAVVTVATK